MKQAIKHLATCVAIAGRAVLIEGAPGAGKSSLALALIDRGAVLVGDDGVTLTREGGRLLASPVPKTAGLLEVRGLGLITMPVAAAVPVALVIELSRGAPRFIERAEVANRADVPIPHIQLWPDSPVLPLRAELALRHYGLAA